MRPKVNSNQLEISNRFEKSFRLHGNFTTANLRDLKPLVKIVPFHSDFTAATF